MHAHVDIAVQSDYVCACLQNINIASTDAESAQTKAQKKRDIAIAVPTVIGGVAILGALMTGTSRIGCQSLVILRVLNSSLRQPVACPVQLHPP